MLKREAPEGGEGRAMAVDADSVSLDPYMCLLLLSRQCKTSDAAPSESSGGIAEEAADPLTQI